MATVTQLAELLRVALAALPAVDQSSIGSYFPPIKTVSVALVITPLWQRTRAITPTAGRGTVVFWHQIRCEFWVKLNPRDLDESIELVREIGLSAIQVLLTNVTLNNNSVRVGWYGQGAGQSVEAETDDRPTEIAGVSYLITTVTVPITDYGA